MSTECLEPMFGKRILFLSPHADDIAYSIGGTVARLSMRADLHLLTIFGRSGWMLSESMRKNSIDVISAQREQEDRAYCVRRNILYGALSCADSFIMGYDDAAELSSTAVDDPRLEKVVSLIRSAVLSWTPQVVFAPCGLGGHVDHQIVRYAADTLDGFQVIYYEDIPYCSYLSLTELEAQLAFRGLRLYMKVGIDAVLGKKYKDMCGYTSQVSISDVSGMLFHARRIGNDLEGCVERLWCRAG